MSLSITSTLWILLLSSSLPTRPNDDPPPPCSPSVRDPTWSTRRLKCGSPKHILKAWAAAANQPHFLLHCFTNGSWKLNQDQGWRCTDGFNSRMIRVGMGPTQCADWTHLLASLCDNRKIQLVEKWLCKEPMTYEVLNSHHSSFKFKVLFMSFIVCSH